MTALDRSIITPTIAARNALPYFEVVIRDWGSGPDDGIGRFYPLPNIPLTGIAIGPESTVDQVYVLEDFTAYTGSLSAYDPITFGAQMEQISSSDNPVPPDKGGFGSGQTGGGQLRAHRSNLSVHAPLIKPIGSGVAIVARNQSRFNEHYFKEDGSDGQFPSTRYLPPVLVLRCYIRSPGPISYASSRVPILSNTRLAAVSLDKDNNPVQYGSGPDFIAAALSIGGRRKFHLDLWALPDKFSGVATGKINVRASVLRGGEAKAENLNNPDWSGNFFEEEIVPTTLLTPGATGGATNKVRFEELDNSAEWLLLFVEQTTLVANICDFSFVVRAED